MDISTCRESLVDRAAVAFSRDALDENARGPGGKAGSPTFYWWRN